MASVRVTHTIGDLESDAIRVAKSAPKRLAEVARRNVKFGNELARRYARESSGAHGKSYFKRISSQMTGPMSGEWGPTGKVAGNAVGGGWRHGVNTDLPRSADVVGPKAAKEAGDALQSLFWPR